MRIAPRPSAPTATKPAKPAEGVATPSTVAIDHFTEASTEFFIAKAAQLNTGDHHEQLQRLELHLDQLKLEKHALDARIAQLESQLAAPGANADAINQQLDQARAELATVDGEITDVEQQIAALQAPPPAEERLKLPAQLLWSKPIIP